MMDKYGQLTRVDRCQTAGAKELTSHSENRALSPIASSSKLVFVPLIQRQKGKGGRPGSRLPVSYSGDEE